LNCRPGLAGATQKSATVSAHDSIGSIERLVAKLRVECVFQRRKSVYLACEASDAALLRTECVARQAAGIDVEYWDESEVAADSRFRARLRWSPKRPRSSTVIDSPMHYWHELPGMARAFSTRRW
jgi:hypothetical protein